MSSNLCFGLLFSILIACQGIVIFAKSSSPVYAFGQRSCVVRKFYLSGVCCVGNHVKDGVVPVNPDSVFLSAERTTLPLLISSYIAKFLDPSSGYGFVVLGIHATRYNLRCLGSCRPGFRYSAPLSSLGFRPRFSIMFKLLRFHSLLANNAHTRVLLRMSLLYRVTRHARHCQFTIHNSRFTVIFKLPQVSLCPPVVSRRHPIASLIRIWSSSSVYSWCFVRQAQSYFGENFFWIWSWSSSSGYPTGGEGGLL